ncbi:MAG: STAS domain-containing protein [Acidobacteria bacterium]|nr:STAS domain-containing protein [Acidobacteriota bacterium]MCL5286475.1 STAS domain-containing protein [Acidobacteriota bacterium]
MGDKLEIQKLDGSRPGQRVLRLIGALSLQTVPDFLKVARAETAPVLIVEFSGVVIVDSAGVGALLQTMASMNKASRKLGLASLGQRTLAVLEITRVINLFQVFPTLAEAEEKLG